ncbi:MAG: tetratricopeptide repeat protein [Leadbetterella sp.]|nr:tetratricopeptide repeat protein [Leadbetterella sp.]
MKKCLFLILICSNLSFGQNKKLDSLVFVTKTMIPDTNKVNTLIEIAQGYLNKEIKKSEFYGREALKLSKQLAWTKGELTSIVRLNYYLFLQSNYNEALNLVDGGLELSKNTKDEIFEGRLSNSRAQIMIAYQNYQEAILSALNALRIGEKYDIFRIKKNALKNLGSIYTVKGDFKKALDYQKKCLAYSISKNEELDIALANIDIGLIYENGLLNSDKSIEYIKKAEITFRKFGDQSNEYTALNNLGVSYMRKGAYEIAENYFKKCQDLSQKASLDKVLLVTNSNLALIETYKKNYDLSEKLLKAVLKASEEKNYTLTKARVLDLMTLMYYAKNDFVKGEQYYLIAKNFRDSVSQSSSEILITEAETKYKTAEKEAKLKAAQLENAQNRNWIIGLSLALLGILVSGGLLWRISSIKRKATENEKLKNIEIENQKKLLSAKEIERQRIAKELHDSVGSQLTVVSTSLDNAFYLFENQKLLPEKLENISGEVRLAAQSLRDTIWATYNSEISVADLRSRIQEFVKKFSDENSFNVEINIKGEEVVLTPIEGLNLFRIVQEALNNTQKYASASLVKINADFSEKNYFLEITDNGKGFDLEQNKVTESYGLNNMKTRAEEIEAKLEIKSSLGAGTAIIFEKV